MEHKNVQTMTKAQYLQKVAMAIRDNSYDGAKTWVLVFYHGNFGIGRAMLYFKTKEKALAFAKEFNVEVEKLYYLVDMSEILKEEIRKGATENYE